MDIHELKAFVEVARSGSFSKASEKLYLTQPAISKRIASLENELNIRLFDRIGKKVLLTEAGNKLFPKATDILLQTEDIRHLATNLDKTVSGKLTLGTSHHIGLRRLPPILKAFISQYPDVDLDIKFMDSEKACQAVEAGELEIAIVTLPQTRSDKLNTEIIWHDPLAIMVNPEHPLAQEKRINLKYLSRHPAVIPGKGTYTREILDAELRRHKVTPMTAMSTNYLETLKMLASIGLGWTLLPVTMCDRELVQLQIPGLKLERHLGIVTHRDRTLPNAALALMETCHSHAHADAGGKQEK